MYSRPRRPKGLRSFPLLAGAEIAVAGFLIWVFLRLLRLTIRLQVVDDEEVREHWAARRPILFASWHGRALMLPFFYRGPGASIMNSTSRDGRIISAALARFGLSTTGGSSSRGAITGFLSLLRVHRRGGDVALLPDGPRGPAGQAQAGIMADGSLRIALHDAIDDG